MNLFVFMFLSCTALLIGLIHIIAKPKKPIEYLQLSGDSHLAKQPPFLLALGIPLVLFLSFGSVVWQGYNFEPSAAAYEKFLELSQLPIMLFALAIPATVIVARAHATEQSALNIKTDIEKSKLEFISKLIENTEDILYEKDINTDEKTLSNDSKKWVMCANNLINIMYQYRQLELKTPKALCFSLIESLRTEFYYQLSYKHRGASLPPHFFCGLEDWEEVYENEECIVETIALGKGKQRLTWGGYTNSKENLSRLAPTFTDKLIDKKGIFVIYEFIMAPKIDSIFEHSRAASSLREFKMSYYKVDADYEGRIEEGAIKFLKAQKNFKNDIEQLCINSVS
ncbi:hypothetical protein N480_03745 [Pseudoalteromonas luteoviolacea S2607]|uniref:hypothetical protein n=1 Tax=Pseudoalteromonas luteoviolacea TaxID=43657 RepID=UPI0007B09E96|nr:hypothetical protein [Pseudoalteromonas luteoviolacea]KZN30068.1 hypothetical protein N480_03745 [Pseudoalteromonas luteoviolacea S2607]